MGFTGNELIKAAEFLHIESSTGLFTLFLFLSSLLAFFTLTFSYLFIDTPLTAKIIAKRWHENSVGRTWKTQINGRKLLLNKTSIASIGS